MAEENTSSDKRFDVALSFPGEHRSFVRAVAEALAQQLTQERVFYDVWYEAELARPNLDTYLQPIYRDKAELIVIFLCAEYEKKKWCGLEWRAVRDLLSDKQDAAIMPIRFDETIIPGLFGIDGYIDATNRTSVEIGNLILKRLNLNRKTIVQSFEQKALAPKRMFQQTQQSQKNKLNQEQGISIASSDNLDFEREIDYLRLQSLLETADWKGADQETRNIVFKVCNRFHGETLESENIRQLPDSTFLSVDRLWVEHSEGHFGFSAQQAIWHELENLAGVSYKIFQRFSQSVGWYEADSWVKYENLNFSLKAPPGHLPYCRSWITPTRHTATAQRFHALMLKVRNLEENS